MSTVSALERFYLSLDERELATWRGLGEMVRDAQAFARAVSVGWAEPAVPGVLVAKGGHGSIEVGPPRVPALARDGAPPPHPLAPPGQAINWVVVTTVTGEAV